MAFRFIKASCIAVGTFNIHIIHPEWLGKIGVLPEDKPFDPKGEHGYIEVAAGFPGYRFELKELRTMWFVRPDRLVVETSDPSVDPGASVSKVLTVLPWTPLIAVGNNTRFGAPLEYEDVLKRKCPEISGESLSIKQIGVNVVSTAEAGVLVNLQLTKVENQLILACNVHHNCQESSNKGESAAAVFFDDRNRAKRAAQQIFGGDFES